MAAVRFAGGSRTHPQRSIRGRGALFRRSFMALFTALLGLGTTLVFAQQSAAADAAHTATETFHSEVLGEDRILEIYLPDGYDAHKASGYDVIYVLDGEMLVRFFPPVRAFAEENELMPPVIIVGINNVYWYDRGQDSRERDLLPAHVAGSPLSGGADKFLSFLSSELIPHINAEYNGSGRNILFGHSYAGMFALYTLFKQPQLFDSYIVSDPALWWNDGAVLAFAQRQIGNLPLSGKSLFIGGRSGQINEAFGIKQMTALLRARAPAGLRWHSETQQDEDHGSVRLKNIYDGLKFVYFGHSPSMADFFPRNGIIARGKPATIMTYSSFLGHEPGIRFTLDGSDPKPDSPRFDYGIKISRPAKLTVKQFSNWGPDKIRSGRFVMGQPFASEPLPASFSPGGLHYRCVAGSAAADPAASKQSHETNGRAGGTFDVGSQIQPGPLSCELDGHFKAVAAGYYVFFLEADAQASLSMDGRTLMAINAAADQQTEGSFLVPLMKGMHRIHIEYRHDRGDRHFAFNYLPPPLQPTLAHLPIPVPADLLYGR